MILTMILLLGISNSWIYAKDLNTIEFIKKYIVKEEKPTELIYNTLCWEKYIQLQLRKDLSAIGIKSSSAVSLPSKYVFHNILFLVDLGCLDSYQFLMNNLTFRTLCSVRGRRKKSRDIPLKLFFSMCNNRENLRQAIKATSKKLFASPFRWLVLSNLNISSTEILMDYPVLPDSDLVLAEGIAAGFQLTELHKPAINYSIIFTPRGFYNGTLIDTRPFKETFRRRRDLMGHSITISNVIQDNNSSKYHLVQENRLELQYDAVAKICYIAAKHAFEMLNATTRYIFSYRFGYKVNGQWSGMIQDLHLNKADMGTNCVLFIDRLEVAAYTDTVAPMRMRFIFRQPPLSYVSNIFPLPFSSSVWVAIVICSLACTATLYLTSHWEVKIEKSPTQLDGSIGDALLLTLSAVTQQGCCVEPRRTPGRIMEWVFFACLMALYAAYSANIVVLLQAPSNSIRSLAQLAASGMDLAANDLDYNRFVLSPSQTLTDFIHQSIHDRIIPESGRGQYYHIYEGVERIRKGLFAFHSIVEPVYHRAEETFLEIEKCDLTEVDFINSFDASTPVKKDSPYLEILRVVYKQLRESGILSALNRRLQTPKPRCSNKQAAFSSVGLLDLRPVLMLMLYGTVLSLTIMLMEMAAFKLARLYKQNKKFINFKTKRNKFNGKF